MMNNSDLFIYAQTNKNRRALSETSETLKALIDRSITSIEFPDGIATIGERAFSDCKAVTEPIVIPNSVETIDKFAFYGCTMPNVMFEQGLLKQINNRAFQYARISEIIIPHGVLDIDYQAFHGCNNAVLLSLPNTMNHIGYDAFLLCVKIENVILENGFNANGLDVSASSLFSVDTLVSMLNALADRTGLAAYTLTLGSTNLAKLNNEQLAIATDKNWTLA